MYIYHFLSLMECKNIKFSTPPSSLVLISDPGHDGRVSQVFGILTSLDCSGQACHQLIYSLQVVPVPHASASGHADIRLLKPGLHPASYQGYNLSPCVCNASRLIAT